MWRRQQERDAGGAPRTDGAAAASPVAQRRQELREFIALRKQVGGATEPAAPAAGPCSWQVIKQQAHEGFEQLLRQAGLPVNAGFSRPCSFTLAEPHTSAIQPPPPQQQVWQMSGSASSPAALAVRSGALNWVAAPPLPQQQHHQLYFTALPHTAQELPPPIRLDSMLPAPAALTAEALRLPPSLPRTVCSSVEASKQQQGHQLSRLDSDVQASSSWSACSADSSATSQQACEALGRNACWDEQPSGSRGSLQATTFDEPAASASSVIARPGEATVPSSRASHDGFSAHSSSCQPSVLEALVAAVEEGDVPRLEDDASDAVTDQPLPQAAAGCGSVLSNSLAATGSGLSTSRLTVLVEPAESAVTVEQLTVSSPLPSSDEDSLVAAAAALARFKQLQEQLQLLQAGLPLPVDEPAPLDGAASMPPAGTPATSRLGAAVSTPNAYASSPVFAVIRQAESFMVQAQALLQRVKAVTAASSLHPSAQRGLQQLQQQQTGGVSPASIGGYRHEQATQPPAEAAFETQQQDGQAFDGLVACGPTSGAHLHSMQLQPAAAVAQLPPPSPLHQQQQNWLHRRAPVAWPAWAYEGPQSAEQLAMVRAACVSSSRHLPATWQHHLQRRIRGRTLLQQQLSKPALPPGSYAGKRQQVASTPCQQSSPPRQQGNYAQAALLAKVMEDPGTYCMLV